MPSEYTSQLLLFTVTRHPPDRGPQHLPRRPSRSKLSEAIGPVCPVEQSAWHRAGSVAEFGWLEHALTLHSSSGPCTVININSSYLIKVAAGDYMQRLMWAYLYIFMHFVSFWFGGKPIGLETYSIFCTFTVVQHTFGTCIDDAASWRIKIISSHAAFLCPLIKI